MKLTAPPFTGLSLSDFCMQISTILKSVVPLYVGLHSMSGASKKPQEKAILAAMAQHVQAGMSFSQAVSAAQCFPSYALTIIAHSERNGTLDVAMEGLADYYAKEHNFTENLRKAMVYPAIMLLLLAAILFLLFHKVVPIFSGVYGFLGTTMPSTAQSILHLGSLLSGMALIAAALLIGAVLLLITTKQFNKEPAWVTALTDTVKTHSKIARANAEKRFCHVMSLTFQCGLEVTEGLTLAEGLVDHKTVEIAIYRCHKTLTSGKSFWESAKAAQLFSDFDLQLIRTESRIGQLTHIMGVLAENYDTKTSEGLNKVAARMELTLIFILIIAVGLVLLSVLLPIG